MAHFFFLALLSFCWLFCLFFIFFWLFNLFGFFYPFFGSLIFHFAFFILISFYLFFASFILSSFIYSSFDHPFNTYDSSFILLSQHPSALLVLYLPLVTESVSVNLDTKSVIIDSIVMSGQFCTLAMFNHPFCDCPKTIFTKYCSDLFQCVYKNSYWFLLGSNSMKQGFVHSSNDHTCRNRLFQKC